MASELDRRRYPRARFAWRAAVGFRDAEELVDARTVNISLGGVCLHGPLAARVVRTNAFSDLEQLLHLEFNWFADSGRDRLARLTRAV